MRRVRRAYYLLLALLGLVSLITRTPVPSGPHAVPKREPVEHSAEVPRGIEPRPETAVMRQAASPIVEHEGAGPARFALRDRNAAVFFTDRGLRFSLGSKRGTWALDWGLVSAAPVPPRPGGTLPGRVYDFTGKGSSDRPSFSRVAYEGAKSGVDLVVDSRPHAVKYSLRLQPGADTCAIWMRYSISPSMGWAISIS